MCDNVSTSKKTIGNDGQEIKDTQKKISVTHEADSWWKIVRKISSWENHRENTLKKWPSGKRPREKTPRKDLRENRRTKGRPLGKTDEIMRKTISLLVLFCLTYLYILSKIFLKTAVFWTHSNNPHSSLSGTTAWNDQQDTKRVIHSTTIILIWCKE